MQAISHEQNSNKIDEESKETVKIAEAAQGMLLRQTSLLSKNEVKLLFKPYTREDLQAILMDLFLKHIS